jgi:carboxypeptidase T
MTLIARPFHYHVWHDPALDVLPDFSARTRSIPRMAAAGTESRQFYSLKKDLASLRSRGVAKGIVDPGVVSIGASQGGRELWALKVGLGAAHKVLFTGCHHAREWISVEIPYLVAEYLIETYTATPTTEREKRLKHLLQNRQIWFVPMSNPDGHMHTVTANRMWRPNRRAYALPAGSSARSPADGGPVSWPAGTYTGVDINRNYATANWGVETFDGGRATTSRDPRDSGANSIWCGRAASGENESHAIDALIRANAFRSSITFHSFSQLLLYPDAAGAHPFVQWVGGGMRDLINAGGNPYTYQSGSGLYPTSGDLMDFTYQTVPNRPTFTPELRPADPPGDPTWIFSGLPENQIEPCFRETLGACLALINCAGHDTPAGPQRINVATANPASRSQFVRPCWQVFSGWAP